MATSRLLLGSSLSGQIMVRAGDKPVLLRYEELRALLVSRAPQAADLFAQPVLDSRNDEPPTRVSWYGPASQEPVTFDKLQPSTQAAAVAALRDRFAALAPLFTDPGAAPLLRAALCVPGPDNILWSGDAPVLVNWGVMPESLGDAPGVLESHFAETFADFALPGSTPWASPPPPQRVRSFADVAASEVVGQAPPQAAVPPPLPPPPAPASVIWHRPLGALSAVLIAVVIVLLVSLVSLCSGYYYGWSRLAGLVQATAPAVSSPSLDPELRRMQESVNEGLRRRLAQLQASLQGDVCVAAGQARGAPQSTPIPGAGGAADGGGVGAAPGGGPGGPPGGEGAAPPAGLEPAPEQQPVQPPATPGHAAARTNLADMLDQSVVMVLGEVTLPDGKTGMSTGTGFAISPGTIVTNLHVVKDVHAGKLFVVNRTLGHPVAAQVVARTPGTDFGQADFAVLKLSEGALSPLAVSKNVDRLQSVVAVGFPGFVTDAGDDFQHLMNGDAGSVPGAHFTTGEVSDIQSFHSQQVVIHTAAINRGNSGGPLADRCGRVVGINTFIRTDQEVAYRVDYALPAASLLDFLAQQNIPLQSDDATCHPEALAAAPEESTPGTPPGAHPSAAAPADH